MNCTNAEHLSLGEFWGNEQTRSIVLHDRFDQHLDTHTISCFKKDDECRHIHPFGSRLDHADFYEDESAQEVFYHSLDGKVTSENRFTLLLHRPQGCQYLNTHNTVISDVLNCNNNIQTGDSGQTFYQTVYTLKSNTKADTKPRDLVANQVCRQL